MLNCIKLSPIAMILLMDRTQIAAHEFNFSYDFPDKADTSVVSRNETSTPSIGSTKAPSFYPSDSPTGSKTAFPSTSHSPTAEPTVTPSVSPSAKPSPSPTAGPTVTPSASPSSKPSHSPTTEPTASPSTSPSTKPSPSPTAEPTVTPSISPSAKPSPSPTAGPTVTPSVSPSSKPSHSPTTGPTASPSTSPSTKPSPSPTAEPTVTPSASPSSKPSPSPTAAPTTMPSVSPSTKPSPSPSAEPTVTPSASPSTTTSPSTHPTLVPTAMPSKSVPCQDTRMKFDVNGKKRHCRWVAIHNPKDRCSTNKDIAESCPVTCEKPACRPFDNPNKFWFNGRSRGCNFANTNPEIRCINNIIRSHCPVTCKDYLFYEETSSPTASPTISRCQDTRMKFDVNGKERHCRWVAIHNPEDRCSKNKDIAQSCPVTCGGTCEPFDNPNKFWFNGRSRGCNFANTNPETRCINNIIRSHCPVTCKDYLFAPDPSSPIP